MKEKADQKNDNHNQKSNRKRGVLMDVFRVVKEYVTARQVAEYYGRKSVEMEWLVVRSMMTSIPV